MSVIERVQNSLKRSGFELTMEQAADIYNIVTVSNFAEAFNDLGKEEEKEIGEAVEKVFNDFSKIINGGNRKRGFWEDFDKHEEKKELRNAFICQFIMLVNTELSEAVEALREGNLTEPFDKLKLKEMLKAGTPFKTAFKVTIKDKFEDEIADAIIRLLDLAGGLNIDIGYFIAQKLKYNSTREYKHGKQM